MPNWRRIARWLTVAGVFSVNVFPVAQAQWHETDQKRWISLQQIKTQSIDPEKNADAAVAHAVFAQLLRAWDSPRLAPTLNVIDAGSAVWAASLDDGSVLITRAALAITLNGTSASARLAFVLAHELGHQQSDHLWRQRYFRLAGKPSEQAQKESVATRDEAAILYEQERQADADGLVLMILSGFDPHAVVGDTDYFDDWIASIQGRRCVAQAGEQLMPACREALLRIAEARDRLTGLAAQAALFEMGLQAYASADYRQALTYFTAFGRTIPAPSVYANLGLAHLALALQLRREHLSLQASTQADLIYPLILSSSALPESIMVQRGGASTPRPAPVIRQELAEQIAAAITNFEKVIGLRPQDSAAFLHLTAAYLADDNVPMAKGVLHGRYGKHFQPNPVSMLLQAGIAHAEGQRVAARIFVEKAIVNLQGNGAPITAQREAMLYTAYDNLVRLIDTESARQQQWRSLAEWANQRGLAILFEHARLRALVSVTTVPPAHASNTTHLVDEWDARMRSYLGHEKEVKTYTVWFDGEKLSLRVFKDGAHLVLDKSQTIRAAWLRFPKHEMKRLNAQRIVAKYGVPDRLIVGDERVYLTYQQSAFGFEMIDREATGWFRYINTSERGSVGIASQPQATKGDH